MICINDNHKHTESKICVRCNAVYYKPKTRSKRSWAASQFCSNKCINIGRSPVTKGKKTGKPAWNTGRKSPETSGPNNPAWKGTDSKFYRKLVLNRDDYTCRVCGFREPEIMQVDHIKSKALFPEVKFDPNNMETLCPNCHARKTVRQLKDGISQMGRQLRAS